MEVLKEVKKMFIQSATKVRNDWGGTLDVVAREKPIFIKRSRDNFCLLNKKDFNLILDFMKFSAKEYTEEDGSITLSLNEIDIVANGSNHEEALNNLVEDMQEYAEDYYQDFSYWFTALNRKKHYPYIIRILTVDNVNQLKELVNCQVGKN
jgi:antitoxin YefM